MYSSAVLVELFVILDNNNQWNAEMIHSVVIEKNPHYLCNLDPMADDTSEINIPIYLTNVTEVYVILT